MSETVLKAAPKRAVRVSRSAALGVAAGEHDPHTKRRLRALLTRAGLARHELARHAGTLLDILVEDWTADTCLPRRVATAGQRRRTTSAIPGEPGGRRALFHSGKYAVIPIEQTSAEVLLQPAAAHGAPQARRSKASSKRRTPANAPSNFDSSSLAHERELAQADALHAATDPLVDAGHLIKTTALARGLGVQRQAITAAIKARRMFSFRRGKDEWVPAFYGDATLDRRQLEQVTRVLGGLPASTKWLFFTQPRASLDGLTPLAALRRGRLDHVLRIAHAAEEA